MPSGEYWKRRMESIEDMSHKKGADYLNQVDKQFRLAENSIEKKIDYWYMRMADNNGVSFSAAQEMLRADELEDFHMSVEEYIKKGESLEYDKRWAKQLENASAKMHITRLEALKMQMQQECEVLYGNLSDGLDSTMRDIYTNGYYHTAYEIQKGFEVGYAFNRLDNRRIERALNTCWTNDGNTFRARCWTNKNKLVNELNTILTQNIIRGESPQKAIEALTKRMKVSRYNAGRLIMTESAFISSASQRDCYKELDVEQFQFVATLDSRTSEICREMDGKVFKMSDYEVGVNAPPLHCFCRSCTVPYFPDDVGERIARGEDGENYYVPSDMTYKDWKKKHVDKRQDKPLVLNNAEHKVRSKEEITKSAVDINEYLENIVSRPSKWNGKVEVRPQEQPNIVKGNNEIAIAENAGDIAVIHELLHTRSYSHYTEIQYLQNRGMEEASVEFLAREIAEMNLYPLPEAAQDIVTLQKVNKCCKIGKNDYEFALKLFEVDMTDRSSWLVAKICNSGIDDNISDSLIAELSRGGIIE